MMTRLTGVTHSFNTVYRGLCITCRLGRNYLPRIAKAGEDKGDLHTLPGTELDGLFQGERVGLTFQQII